MSNPLQSDEYMDAVQRMTELKSQLLQRHEYHRWGHDPAELMWLFSLYGWRLRLSDALYALAEWVDPIER